SCCGTGTYGTITLSAGSGAFAGDVKVTVDMDPNNLILTGQNKSHHALTFDMATAGEIVAIDPNYQVGGSAVPAGTGFSIDQNDEINTITNDPYKFWNYAID